MSDAPPTSARGPIDPRVLGLSPALRVHLVASTVAAGFVAAAVLVQAEAISHLLPELVQGDGRAAPLLAWWLVAVALVRAGAAWTVDRSATRTIVATRRSVRRRVISSLLGVRADRRHELGPADAAALTGSALDALEPYVRSYLPGLPVAVVVPIAAGLRILGADLTSALIVAVVVPLVPIFMILIGRFTEQQQAKQWDALQRLAGRFLDVITGLATLRLFGRATAQVERVHEVTEQYRRSTMRTLRVAFLSALVLELLATLSVALVAVSLGIRLTHGSLSLETALVVLLLTPECLLPIRRVAAAFHAATSGVDAATEVDRVQRLEGRPDGRASLHDGDRGAALVIEATSLVDPERGERLAATSMELRPGELVALRGPSGTGKSSLFDVLRGAVPASSGSASIGGIDLDDLPIGARCQAVRWVPQRPRALGATVRESVALGLPPGGNTDAAVSRALDALGLEHLADHPPVDTSGGERRRTALARALAAVAASDVDGDSDSRCAPPRFLLVDEPTAQLDDVAAARVRDALRWIAGQGVGVIAATHDPVLAATADRTIELTTGRVAVGSSVEAAPAPHAAHAHLDAPPVPDPVTGWASSLGDIDPGDSASALGWVLRTARGQRARLLGGGALGVLTEVCSLGLAATAAWLIVRASEHPSFADLAVAAVGVRAFALGKGALRYGERLTSHDATLRLLADLRATVVERLAHLAPSGLPKQAGGDLLTRLVDDIDRLQDLFLRVLGPAIAAVLVALAAGIATIALDPPGGIALLVAVVLVGLVLPALFHRTARARGLGAARARGEVASAMVSLAEDAEELVAWGATETWVRAVEAPALELDEIDRQQGRRSALLVGITAAVPALATAAVVAVTGPAGGHLSGPALGVLVLLPLAAIELVAPLGAAGEALARVEASAARVFALVSRPEPFPEPASPGPIGTQPTVELTDVALAWPGEPVLVTDVSTRIDPGGRLVVTGPSGSGKSTLAATLVGFIRARHGSYELDGTSADDIGGNGLRRAVTWCPQDPWFADSSLSDNLRIARPSATDDDLEAALRAVHLDRWRASLPEGLATRLRHDASTMSGGERQRLALARALLGGQGVVVLDEPTSHLDEDLADEVRRDLIAALGDRSVVLITHDALDAEALGASTRARIEVGPERRVGRWEPGAG